MTTKKIKPKAVLANARRAIKEYRQQQRKLFSEQYNKTKTFEFPEEGINMIKFFGFPKIFGPGGVGQKMSKEEIAVYPVLCARADYTCDKQLQMPQQEIAKKAGVGVDTQRRAIEKLEKREFPITNIEGKTEHYPFVKKHWTTQGTRHFYMYNVYFVRSGMLEQYDGGMGNDRQKQYFFFYTHLIDSGVWADLYPRSKCLYLGLRNNAVVCDMDVYCEIEEVDYNWDPVNGWNNYYRERRWDLCTVPIAEICRRVNIEHSNNESLEQLERCRLVERIGKYVKVYLGRWD